MKIRITYLALILSIGWSYAATYTVTSEADSGAGTLREAVNLALANPGADIIDIDRSSVDTITLTTRHNPIGLGFYLPNLSDLTIQGNGAAIQSGTDFFVLTAAENNVQFVQITFQNFTENVIRSTSNVVFDQCDFDNCIGSPFGVIWQRGGDMTLTGCTFSDCRGGLAGAIWVDFLSSSTTLDDIEFHDCESTNNGGEGNAVVVQYDAQLTISGTCTFTGAKVQDIQLLQGGGELPDPSNTVTLHNFVLTIGSVLQIN